MTESHHEELPLEPITSETPISDLMKRFHATESDYRRLRGDIQGVRGLSNVWDTDYTLEKYTEATDRVIGLMDGSIDQREILDPDNPEASQKAPDVVLWLDKSARPVSWFADALWDQFADSGVKKPEYEFLNIDRVNWFVNQGHSTVDAEARLGPKDFDISKVDMSTIEALRALFVVGNLDEENWQDDIWDRPTRLDGRNLLIIDEVKNRGGTLAIATQLLKRAIPDMTVSGAYFWKPGRYSLGGIYASPDDLQIETVPLWYDPKSSYGRGIGEISKSYWDHLYDVDPTPENFKKKVGWLALSAPHFNPETYEILPDDLATQLQQDIAYLSYAVAEGKVRRIPSKLRDTHRMVDIINRQGLTVNQYRKITEQRESK